MQFPVSHMNVILTDDTRPVAILPFESKVLTSQAVMAVMAGAVRQNLADLCAGGVCLPCLGGKGWAVNVNAKCGA